MSAECDPRIAPSPGCHCLTCLATATIFRTMPKDEDHLARVTEQFNAIIRAPYDNLSRFRL